MHHGLNTSRTQRCDEILPIRNTNDELMPVMRAAGPYAGSDVARISKLGQVMVGDGLTFRLPHAQLPELEPEHACHLTR